VSLIRLGVIGMEPYGFVGTHPIERLGDLRGLLSAIGVRGGAIMGQAAAAKCGYEAE
jgi:hypothetical protein